MQGKFVDARRVYRTSAGHLASEWMLAEVLDTSPKEVLVHYMCLAHLYDEWIDLSEDSSRIACVTWAIQGTCAMLSGGSLMRVAL